jgi:hypothetical protein
VAGAAARGGTAVGVHPRGYAGAATRLLASSSLTSSSSSTSRSTAGASVMLDTIMSFGTLKAERSIPDGARPGRGPQGLDRVGAEGGAAAVE